MGKRRRSRTKANSSSTGTEAQDSTLSQSSTSVPNPEEAAMEVTTPAPTAPAIKQPPVRAAVLNPAKTAYLITYGPIWSFIAHALEWPFAEKGEYRTVKFMVQRTLYKTDTKTGQTDKETALLLRLIGINRLYDAPMPPPETDSRKQFCPEHSLRIIGRVVWPLPVVSFREPDRPLPAPLQPCYPDGTEFREDEEVEIWYNLLSRRGIICRLGDYTPYLPSEKRQYFGQTK